MHAAGAVEPAAAAGPRSTTRSEIAGVVTTEGADGTGRSMTRVVQAAPGRAACFEDQYASTGGELYELMAGHDRLIADLRPLVQSVRAASGLPPGLCCHPYDLCTALIAEEAGVILRDPAGAPVDAPLDLAADVAWVGYANERLRTLVEPVLQGALRRRGLLP